MVEEEARGETRLKTYHAVALAWLLEGTISAVDIGLSRSTLGAGPEVQLYNALEYTALAFLGYLVVKLWVRFAARIRWATPCALLVSCNLLGWLALTDDLTNFSERQAETLPVFVTLSLGVTLVASAPTLTWWVTGYLPARWITWGLIPALGVLVGNRLWVPPDYHGIRFFLALSAITLGVRALSGPVLGDRLAPLVRRLRATRYARNVLLGLACLATALLIATTPRGQVRVAWMQSSTAPLYRALARARGALQIGSQVNSAQQAGEWFVDRSQGSVPPTKGFAHANPIVLMITIDAMRADLVAGDYDDQLPTLARIRDQGLWFKNAHAPGTLTKTSVSSLFMGKYFSQQYWVKVEKGLYSVREDPTRRFPEFLKDAGVRTTNLNAVGWLRNENGQVRGFTKEKRLISKQHGRYTPSKPVIDYFSMLLKRVDEHPLFVHTHLIDAHAPYTLGGKKGSPFESYLAEVAMIDEGLGRLLDTIERGHLEQRTYLIVLADHGEAFGEHGADTHGTNLYEEALHVPLMIQGPGVKPRVIEELVSTMDVGPTILDLFGQPVPRYFMGQSLARYLMGQSPRLTRPVIAEARLMRTLVTPNGLKVIYDTRTGQAELYDLNEDPKELRDLSDDEALLEEPLALLRGFFEVHAYTKHGYSPPFVR